jgi:LmbE family N-acetylglucosaminyl deacetylase
MVASGFGTPTVEVDLVVDVGEALATKRVAMAAHASQIGPAALGDDFADTYELEWFVRRGAPALLETLGNAHAVA